MVLWKAKKIYYIILGGESRIAFSNLAQQFTGFLEVVSSGKKK